MTLVELLVAMGIFVVVLAVFMAGVVSMTRTTARSQAVSDATSASRKVLDRFDKQVRYSTGINMPSSGLSGAYYVDFSMPAQIAGAAPVCIQWRFDPTAGTIALRSWTDSTPPTPTAWSTVAINVRNPMPTKPPFRMIASNAATSQQSLVVYLDIGTVSSPGVVVSTTYVARNTTDKTMTNQDLNLDGLSDTPVCAGVPRP
ncbi:MAG: type II secretion system protein [Cellulomonas sp.]|nr:type II secretion system protein [Cellulomonas sp.]